MKGGEGRIRRILWLGWLNEGLGIGEGKLRIHRMDGRIDMMKESGKIRERIN